MENNIIKIAERIYELTKKQELTTENTEFEILQQITEELLFGLGEIERHEDIKKALVNMFVVGQEIKGLEIKNLEEKYFSLYNKKHDEKEKKTPKREALNLKEGEWIYSDYFKEANKIKKIFGDNVDFHFVFQNGITSGVLNFIENKTDIKTHRYATPEEIKAKLNKEIQKLDDQITETKPECEEHLKLKNQSYSDLYAMLQICRKIGETSVLWQKRATLIENILVDNIKNIFSKQ